MQIVRRETISVPAGSFDTFLIEGNGWNTTINQKLEARLWLVPGVNFAIRREFVVRNSAGRSAKPKGTNSSPCASRWPRRQLGRVRTTSVDRRRVNTPQSKQKSSGRRHRCRGC
jgi:hypothetical protein